MSSGEGMIIYLIVRKIKKKYCYTKMSYFPTFGRSKNKIEVELDLSKYAKKSDFKIVAGVDKSQCARKDNLGNLKLEVDKLFNDKLEKVTGCLSSLKDKMNKSDVDKLVPVLTDLSKQSNIVKYEVVKKIVYDETFKL